MLYVVLGFDHILYNCLISLDSWFSFLLLLQQWENIFYSDPQDNQQGVYSAFKCRLVKAWCRLELELLCFIGTQDSFELVYSLWIILSPAKLEHPLNEKKLSTSEGVWRGHTGACALYKLGKCKEKGFAYVQSYLHRGLGSAKVIPSFIRVSCPAICKTKLYLLSSFKPVDSG